MSRYGQLKQQYEDFAAMSSMDFAALLGNMLDNAIEASLREAKKGRELSWHV